MAITVRPEGLSYSLFTNGQTFDMISRQKNYRASNSILTADFCVSQQASALARSLIKTADETSRQRLGDALLDELADCAGIDIVHLKISAARQYHKKRDGRVVFKQYGYYRPRQAYIYITNRTAVRGQPLAGKTFLDTLLHEWMHHFDYKRLKLVSIHTAGFYARLRDLKARLGYFDA